MRKDDVFLNEKESRRVYVMERLLEGTITVSQASDLLGLSQRHVKRLKAKVRERGIAALAHGNRGRKPKHAVPKETKEAVVSLAAGKYRGASYQHMSELLREQEGISISAKTISRILKEALIPHAHTHKAPRHRTSRNRMPKEGMLVQCDASPHEWLENRSSRMCLHGAIDDATGKVLGLCFRPNEDLMGYLNVLKQMVEKHGVPGSLYSDRHSIFFSPKEDRLTIEEELEGERGRLTQFGRALNQLGINHIKARSPQAKGRIERLWKTLQGRLIVEMRLANICTLEDANDFLGGFINRFNQRFAVEADSEDHAFKPAPDKDALNNILCLKMPRKASGGSTISFEGTVYQLVDRRGSVIPMKPRSHVYVTKHLDGSLGAMYGGGYFRLKPMTDANATKDKRLQEKNSNQEITQRSGHKPPINHPWRRSLYGKSCSIKRQWEGHYGYGEDEWRNANAAYETPKTP